MVGKFEIFTGCIVGFSGGNKTGKLYGTLGPACADTDTLRALLRAGMRGVRLNLSHGPLEERAPWLESLRRAETAEGVSCDLLIDLQGPELRVGALFAPLTLREGDIRPACLRHFEDIGHDPAVRDVTYENAQARERTQVLMDIANQQNGIVVGTGDLSELALGWATYNGDHMSMYGVNGSIPKTLVRYLVRHAADTCGDEALAAVLYDILDTPVSPELLPAEEDGTIAQKTEDLVGPYELHDFFLYHFIRYGCPPRKILHLAELAFAGRYDRAAILKWLRTFFRRFFQQQFKRSCLPDGPKVGSVTLSPRGDWRMPSDASAALWLRELEDLQ